MAKTHRDIFRRTQEFRKADAIAEAKLALRDLALAIHQSNEVPNEFRELFIGATRARAVIEAERIRRDRRKR